jgi:hypothetical protein
MKTQQIASQRSGRRIFTITLNHKVAGFPKREITIIAGKWLKLAERRRYLTVSSN